MLLLLFLITKLTKSYIHEFVIDGVTVHFEIENKKAYVTLIDCQIINYFSIPSTLTIENNIFDIIGISPKACSLSNFKKLKVGNYISTISNDAFRGNKIIESVDIQSSRITSIGDYAFEGCISLQEFLFCGGLETIGNFAFCNTSLAEVEIPTLQKMGEGAFANTPKLFSANLATTDLEVIPKGAFLSSAVTKIDWPSNLQICENSSFMSSGIVDVNAPKTLTSIEFDGFISSYNLKRADFSLCERLTRIWHNAFLDCKALSILVLPPKLSELGGSAFVCTAIEDIVLPKTVGRLLQYLFFGCENLILCDLSKTSANLVPLACFKMCKNLRTVKLPQTIERIQMDAFYDSGITDLKPPSLLYHIGPNAFHNAKNLIDLDLSGTRVAEIYEHAFAFSGIRSLKLPNTVKWFGDGAFESSMITMPFKFPSELEVISCNSFKRCTNLGEVDLTATKVRVIGEYAFSECGLISFKASKYLEVIEMGAFEKNMISELILNKNLRHVGAMAFADCPDLFHVDLSESKLHLIPNEIFRSSNVRNVKLPRTLELIDCEAFASDKVLSEFYYCGEGELLGKNGLRNTNANITIHVSSDYKFSTVYNFTVIKDLDCRIHPEPAPVPPQEASTSTNSPQVFSPITSSSQNSELDDRSHGSSFNKKKGVVYVPRVHAIIVVVVVSILLVSNMVVLICKCLEERTAKIPKENISDLQPLYKQETSSSTSNYNENISEIFM